MTAHICYHNAPFRLVPLLPPPFTKPSVRHSVIPIFLVLHLFVIGGNEECVFFYEQEFSRGENKMFQIAMHMKRH